MSVEQTDQNVGVGAETYGGVRTEQLWRVRLKLLWNSLRSSWAIFSENPIGMIGLVIIFIFGLMALSHPILMATVWDAATYDPIVGFDYTIDSHPSAPSAAHLLGTDPIGRDVLSQLLYSTSSEFGLGIVAALVTVTIGTSIGAVAAFYGGVIDSVLMRLADLVIMIPSLPLLIVLGAFFELNLLMLAFVIGILSGFGGVTVIIKSQALTIKVKPFIEAARVAGGSDFHIIFTHIVPNLLPLAFLYMMFTVTTAIFSEAVLSFFGLMNIRMSWGIMINLAQSEGYLLRGFEFWWLLFPASIAITLLCAAFYLVGRALDEVVNPRLRKR
ncbi:MAG: ABC transporter permease [Chloroflexi bacterium]|nr:ABC transporter permease [Chloroflexota bacterium]